MKFTIWIVLGIFEGGGEVPALALFMDENLAEIRRSEMAEHEDCLEAQVIGFETDFDNELKPIK